MPELWRAITGHEGAYEVSNLGRVRSLPGHYRHAKVLKPHGVGRGYLAVTPSQGGVAKNRYVHHLVAEAFIGPRPDGLDVCHNNGDMLDNRAENLRYDTVGGNMRDAIAQGTHREASRSQCSAGHEYTADNTLLERRRSVDGHVKTRRRCRVCLARHRANSYARGVAA